MLHEDAWMTDSRLNWFVQTTGCLSTFCTKYTGTNADKHMRIHRRYILGPGQGKVNIRSKI